MSTSPEDLLGPNSWLVDEYREAYEADPSSVSEQWRNYFSNGAATAGDGNGARAATSTTSSSDTPSSGTTSANKPSGQKAEQT